MDVKYSRDKKVQLDPRWYSFKRDKTRLVSISALIRSYKNPFDTEKVAGFVAARDGVEPQVIIDAWATKGLKSRTIGTAIHKIFEDYFAGKYSILNGYPVFENEPDLPEDYLISYINKRKSVVKFIREIFMTGRLKPVYVEEILYNDKIALLADLICQDAAGNYFILDTKTDEEISKTAYKNAKMLRCMSEFPDSNFYHHSTQLSAARELFEHPCETYVLHLKDGGYKLLKTENVFDKVPFNQFINEYEPLNR